MALQQGSYVLLCAVAGDDILNIIMLAELAERFRSSLGVSGRVLLSRWRLLPKLKRGACSVLGPNSIAIIAFSSTTRLYQATRCHQRT